MFFILLMLFINGIEVFSINQHKFCPTAKWNSDASTFNEKIIAIKGSSMFIDKKNTIYALSRDKARILIWPSGQIQPIIINCTTEARLHFMFVSNIGDIYISATDNTITQWIANTNEFVDIMTLGTLCWSMFIDVSDNLYCTMLTHHKVIRMFFKGDILMNIKEIAATGFGGSGPHELERPHGIFVDTNFDLYVADCDNQRIQFFLSGEKNGKTVAGRTSLDITITLHDPVSIVLDADKYLFISDSLNHRIIGSGPNGFRCLIGCRSEDVESDQSISPAHLTFDVDGNMFVIDYNDARIQKFDIEKDSCVNVPTTIQTVYSSTLTTNHSMFSRTIFNNSNYYYEAIQIAVTKNDFYILTGNSTINLYGFLYKDFFSPFIPTANLIAWYGNCCDKEQFKFTLELKIGIKYILVITTYNPRVIGSFSIILFGSNMVHFEQIGE
ncbi:unnamed protein product [Adineta ricciae]|uniref:Uncharacterized protein n=1 Tax=Adineta ricciae TaxID=249248 RepID=A0A814R6M5_ADIRI|nr:unnamed protein product [Adineta ricciae]